MAVNTFRNKTRSTPMAKYIHSTIQCQVALDRLDQATIDQIMDTSTSDISTKAIAIVRRSIYLLVISLQNLISIIFRHIINHHHLHCHQPQ